MSLASSSVGQNQSDICCSNTFFSFSLSLSLSLSFLFCVLFCFSLLLSNFFVEIEFLISEFRMRLVFISFMQKIVLYCFFYFSCACILFFPQLPVGVYLCYRCLFKWIFVYRGWIIDIPVSLLAGNISSS